MFGKLYIYDLTSPEDRNQADGRTGDGITTLAVTSRQHLVAELSRLVVEKNYFDRVLFQTHGSPGCVKFNGVSIYDTTLREYFLPGGFHRLFPLWTKFYFDGCNVAAGSIGDDFLEATGKIFLRSGGGEVLGWTTPGYGMSSWIPFIGGHTIHPSGGLKRVEFNPGGIKVEPVYRNPLDDNGRLERGFKV